jgi:hypothetical protein
MPDDLIQITMQNGDTFDDGLLVRVVPAKLLGPRHTLTFGARSDMRQTAVVASVEVTRSGSVMKLGDVTVVKDPPPGVVLLLPGPLDNKHAGSSGGDGDDEDDDGV